MIVPEIHIMYVKIYQALVYGWLRQSFKVVYIISIIIMCHTQVGHVGIDSAVNNIVVLWSCKQ